MDSNDYQSARALAMYRRWGIEMEETPDGRVLVRQTSLPDGILYTQRELIERGKTRYPDRIVNPVTYHFDASQVTLSWIKEQVQRFGLKEKDLCNQLALPKATIQDLLAGRRPLDRLTATAFFYYFLAYRLGTDIRHDDGQG